MFTDARLGVYFLLGKRVYACDSRRCVLEIELVFTPSLIASIIRLFYIFRIGKSATDVYCTWRQAVIFIAGSRWPFSQPTKKGANRKMLYIALGLFPFGPPIPRNAAYPLLISVIFIPPVGKFPKNAHLE